ncbi:DUF1292 domain-containing protein [Anaerobacillus alkalidiazotrophicus]|uniref:DUF1292 domain-containing protein n=1 Tax=Anaerobacillus alkalidiazotrophicus TaxID=472963 RepID=A0A1S2M3F9_9BACI|nr:DUF1292 domain-containing protein [Anaerobacillus alkalidiazotrophicus]OIJ19228.1 DUF1292 domain-containing protein [Anaerobacillus alkalidiazotrophicus]
MEIDAIRDQITIEDENGNMKDYNVEGLFDMEDNSYVLLSDDGETILMRIEDQDNEQFLVGITNPDERDSILTAYELAVEAEPTEIQ